MKQTQEQKRINLLDIASEDTNVIKVGEVMKIFSGILDTLVNSTNTFKEVKQKLGDDAYTKMLHSLINSFSSSLYITASKDEKEFEKRMTLVNDANSDLHATVALVKEKDEEIDA